MIEVSNLRIWALGFTSIAIGALAVMALCLAMAGRNGERGNGQLRLALALACLSAILVLATHGPFALLVLWEATGRYWPAEWRLLFTPFGECLVGLLWLSVMILFEDARITPPRLAPAGLQTGLSVVTLLSAGQSFTYALGWLAVAINLALAGHAFVRVAQGWRGDLVEKRRRLRRPFLLVLGLVLALVLTVQGAEFGARVFGVADAITTPVYGVLNIAVAVMALATGALFLEPRIALVPDPAPMPLPTTDADADAALAKLETLMTRDEVWRREGLTVGRLATEVGMPEHKLRVLINGQLGHRNFAAFINARRIDTARRQLADPAFTDTPVSKIAYDLGFASLGPFNRAFKDATGVTPTEWRRSRKPPLS